MNILIVDDDVALVKQLNLNLSAENYKVCNAHCLASARSKINSKSYDVILLDYQLGVDSGLDLFSSLKKLNDSPFVILMTSYATKNVAVDALNSGVGHFIEKPFMPTELKSILAEKLIENEVFDFKLDPNLNSVILNDKTIKLTEIEFKILNHFIEHANSLISKEDLHRSVYQDNIKAVNAVNTHLTNLKNKLPVCFGSKLKTIRGKGYIFETVS